MSAPLGFWKPCVSPALCWIPKRLFPTSWAYPTSMIFFWKNKPHHLSFGPTHPRKKGSDSTTNISTRALASLWHLTFHQMLGCKMEKQAFIVQVSCNYPLRGDQTWCKCMVNLSAFLLIGNILTPVGSGVVKLYTPFVFFEFFVAAVVVSAYSAIPLTNMLVDWGPKWWLFKQHDSQNDSQNDSTIPGLGIFIWKK